MIDKKHQEEISKLLDVLPPLIKIYLENHANINSLIEVVLDLGKHPEARFSGEFPFYFQDKVITQEDINFVTGKISHFTSDNRAGIERTLHRISAIKNRMGRVVGLTCRVGRAIYGTNDIIRDIIESEKNILFLGPPGIGKTTKLREAARILSDQFDKRVVVVDTSNEIAGDGDIPHLGIGKARRMQVPSPDMQHKIMIEAVENHMPEVIIVDEIGTEEEALACRTIAERGVQLIATAHGKVLENLMSNPTLADLIGGIQTVILGDEEAKRRRTQKSILERKAPPTFDILVEIRERDTFAVYHNVANAVDLILRKKLPKPEMRFRSEDGRIEIDKPELDMQEPTDEEAERVLSEKENELLRIYPFGVNRQDVERNILSMQLPAMAVKNLDEADMILTIKTKARPGTKIMRSAEEHNIPVHVIKKNVSSQIVKFLKFHFHVGGSDELEAAALKEIEEAIHTVQNTGKRVDVNPQNSYIRRIQHQLVEKVKLHSESVGEEPERRVRVYPS
ncbi:single-stranded DNA-binding protein [candidate division WOR-1 bacterium RIFOXYA2_FULL_36_21]|uniref:Single-stranded DNA-binding protein n=1 Tax=candidate division WOR-1 bacterium RIFOXYB2_FULL_36_35 TaxID=1802578 RepID=A0A1F4S5Q4_UNCSA|nr:MAG: single-stranded DNA-binding protein [candidate division WOR-1 bacterium RIFOXYA2_FULL_36_21]OGC15729.1 MAG: single-stranded DNA-binding protein [candidate division WOR-1 bacterium RIFOXYB2_FULL_36_35]OGC21084.1 MAG: single-stranded DNA-binding protein [candidate division WOR-1 bacterium RIFOXYA12_FULL_36_13]